MDIEFIKTVKRKENLYILRDEINQKWVSTKISNHLGRNPHLEYSVSEIKSLIMTDDLIGSFFIKEPGRQNLSERVIGEYISNLDSVENFIDHPSSVNLFVVDGKISTDRVDGVKSVDYTWETNGRKVFTTQKYTNEAGGAQDHQFNEVIHFMKNAGSNNEHFFIAIVDGAYYTKDKMNTLLSYQTENVRVCGVLEVEDELSGI